MSTRTGILGAGRILHGADYNPDQWLHQPEAIDEDFRLMRLAGCNTFSIGIFAWTSYEPEEGKYRFDWLDSIMDRFAADGYKAILATPSGAKPAWMALKYPEIRRVDRGGGRETIRDRHNHCWSSPVYREKVTAINTQLATRYAGHPALGMWHLSNEYNGECYCDLCLAKWREWLRACHGSLEALNQHWWTGFWSHTYTAWDEIDPRNSCIDGLQLDWNRFNTQQVVDFFLHEAAPLRRLTPDVPCTTNFMGTFGGLNYAKLAEVVDLVADDQYPCYDPDSHDVDRSAAAISFKDDLFRAFKPGQPWMLMESCPDATQWRLPKKLKRPRVHQAEMLQAIGHGAEGTCYFQWRKGRGGCEKFHGAVVDHLGTENHRIFQDVANLSRLYERLTPVLGSRNQAQVAMIYDWECRWGFECSGGMPNVDGAYDRTCHDHYIPFWEKGVAVDVIASDRDFSGYRVVVAPLLYMLKPGVADRLKAFVACGGVLVSTYASGVADENNRVLLGELPGEGLGEVFGVWAEELDVLQADAASTATFTGVNGVEMNGPFTVLDVRAVVHLRGAEALAIYDEEFYAGSPALTMHRFGEGTAFFAAAKFDVDSLRDLYGALIDWAGLERALDADYPAGVTIQRREKDGERFYFIENFSKQEAPVTLPEGRFERMSDGAVLTGGLELPAFGSEVLRGL